MKTAIEIILALITLYCAVVWVMWAMFGIRQQNSFDGPDILTQFSCIGSGAIMVLALGFLGLML